MPNSGLANRHRPLIAWPGLQHLAKALALGMGLTLWFTVVYGATDYITGLREHRVRVHLDSELGVPFLPSLLVFYMSIYGLFFLSPFVLRTRGELHSLAGSAGLMILCGGAGFLLFPAELAFSTPSVPPHWDWLYSAADTLNLRYNLVPSLHVGLSIVCVDVFATRAEGAGKALLWAWGGLIALSTVLTHQHHVLDVAAGFAVALAISRFVYPRLRRRGDHGTMGRGIEDG